jgi:hypothetical protein
MQPQISGPGGVQLAIEFASHHRDRRAPGHRDSIATAVLDLLDDMIYSLRKKILLCPE